MACRPFGAKPLSEPMPHYPQLETHGNKFQWNLSRTSIILIQENTFENVVCQIGGHFVREVCVCVCVCVCGGGGGGG